MKRRIWFSVAALLIVVFVLGEGRGSAQVSATDKRATKDDIPKMLRAIRASRIEQTIRTLVGFGTRNTLSVQDNPRRGIGAARDYLFAEMQNVRKLSGGRLIVEKQSFLQPVGRRVPTPTTLTNIIATLPGDLPKGQERYVIVSGHYDSMCSSPTDAVNDAPGANDDASGTAAVLELARAMAPYRFRATIVFVCVAGEEQGLLGSTYLAEQAKRDNWNVEAMLTDDIIGGTFGGNGVRDRDSVRVFSEGIATTETESEARTRRSVGGEEDSVSRQLARYIKEASEKYVRRMKVTLIARRDRYLRGGDHIPFNERGFPAVRFTEPNEDYHHQHQNLRTETGIVFGDLPEFVDFDYVAKVARVNGATLASLALAPDIPKGVGLVTRQLTPDTELEWQVSTDDNIGGYEVVWRETTEPNWSHVSFVGKVTRHTLVGVSKDNYFFGVRAVGKSGFRSPVAFPRPIN